MLSKPTKSARSGFGRRGEYRRRWPRLDDRPVAQDHDPDGQRQCIVVIVVATKIAGTPALFPRNFSSSPRSRSRVCASITEKSSSNSKGQVRPKRAGQGHALFSPAHQRSAAGEIGDPQIGQPLGRGCASAGAVAAGAGPRRCWPPPSGAGTARNPETSGRCGAAPAAVGSPRARRLRSGRNRAMEPGDGFQGHRFTGAVWPEDRQDLAAPPRNRALSARTRRDAPTDFRR